MTTIDRFERELPAALSDVAGSGRTDYLTDILGRTARTSQRPAWASLERWLPMDIATVRAPVARIPWRPMLLAALVIALLAALALFVGGQRRLPPPFGPAANGLIPYNANGDIYLGDPATGQARLVAAGPFNDYIPAFSPDGMRLMFLRASADCPTPGDICPGGEDIVVADHDGRNAHPISVSPLKGLRIVTWIPDSQGILVGYTEGSGERLAVYPINGATPRPVADVAEADWAVFRPPSGNELLIRGIVDGQFGLYLLNADGSGRKLLVSGATPGETTADNQDLNFPAFSPDGNRIYFNRYVEAAQTIQAWVMNADGSGGRRLNRDGPACCWWEGEVAPSPDGKWALMWRVPPQGVATSAITIFPADGSGDGIKVGPQVRGTAHWSWSPDSTKILLNFNDATEGDQGLIDVATGAFTTLPWKADTEPDWQRTMR